MAEKDSAFLKKLLATFRIEAREHVNAMFSGVAELEKMPGEVKQAELVEAIFREAHSLKGAARSVNLMLVENACQSLETTFAAMKRKELMLTTELFDSLHQALNRLSSLPDISSPESSSVRAPVTAPATPRQTTAEPAPDLAPEAQPALSQASVDAQNSSFPIRDEKLLLGSTVRIATEKLDSIFTQVEEMLAAKLATQQRKQDMESINALTASWGKEWANIRTRHPDFYNTLAKQPQWLELIEQNATFIKNLTYKFGAMSKAVDQDQRILGRMVDDLLEDMKKALMLPFSTLMELFPRLVRNLAKDHGKEIELVVQGGEIVADRRILEELKDPLIHLVRNCIDHGIEKPAERIRCDKPARGKIVIAILPRSSNRVEINISDDGSGIEIAKVKATAQRLGLLTEDEALRLDDRKAAELIFQSGLSTSSILTEISGRGLGLAIVHEKVEKLGGTVTVETQPDVGTKFKIVLPLTLATYRGITVSVGEQQFVLPTRNVEQTVRIHKAGIQTVENRETIRVNDETVSLAWLGDILELPRPTIKDTDLLQVVVLSTGGKSRIAFVVDEVLSEQEVLVKSLGRQLRRVRNIAAATVLGSGKAVPILNVSDLLKSAQQVAIPRPISTAGKESESTQDKNVLVVEDSITARSLLKGILEIAGYKVTTAVDGIDGFTQLRSGQFDIVVSDVEMPRMDGFDLTAKIRSDKKLAELPVVLVTALESSQDRERGIDVGANAYIVKRSFEQSNLLEIIRRLV
jgi:two-component system chemotaxis sensor kinase CheA